MRRALSLVVVSFLVLPAAASADSFSFTNREGIILLGGQPVALDAGTLSGALVGTTATVTTASFPAVEVIPGITVQPTLAGTGSGTIDEVARTATLSVPTRFVVAGALVPAGCSVGPVNLSALDTTGTSAGLAGGWTTGGIATLTQPAIPLAGVTASQGCGADGPLLVGAVQGLAAELGLRGPITVTRDPKAPAPTPTPPPAPASPSLSAPSVSPVPAAKPAAPATDRTAPKLVGVPTVKRKGKKLVVAFATSEIVGAALTAKAGKKTLGTAKGRGERFTLAVKPRTLPKKRAKVALALVLTDTAGNVTRVTRTIKVG